jgi:hypothetical protein
MGSKVNAQFEIKMDVKKAPKWVSDVIPTFAIT